jgi:hypothetical protein
MSFKYSTTHHSWTLETTAGPTSDMDTQHDTPTHGSNARIEAMFHTPLTGISIREWHHEIVLIDHDDKRAVRLLYGCKIGPLSEVISCFGKIEKYNDFKIERGCTLIPAEEFTSEYEAECQDRSSRGQLVIEYPQVLDATCAVITEVWRALCADSRPEGLPAWIQPLHKAEIARLLAQPKPWNPDF